MNGNNIGFFSETRLDFQQRYKSIQLWHKIPKELIANFEDKNPLPYICVSKHILEKSKVQVQFP